MTALPTRIRVDARQRRPSPALLAALDAQHPAASKPMERACNRTTSAVPVRFSASLFALNVGIADFICPTSQTRGAFGGAFTIWIDQMEAGHFEDTNPMFVAPERFGLRVIAQDYVRRLVRVISHHLIDASRDSAIPIDLDRCVSSGIVGPRELEHRGTTRTQRRITRWEHEHVLRRPRSG
jgi:hypothetical protein